jgi:trimethylguanosine synthase
MSTSELQIAVTNSYSHDKFNLSCLCCASIARSYLIIENTKGRSDVEASYPTDVRLKPIGVLQKYTPSCYWCCIGHLTFPKNRSTGSAGDGDRITGKQRMNTYPHHLLTTPGLQYSRESSRIHRAKRSHLLQNERFFNQWTQCFDYGSLRHYYACKRNSQTQWLPPNLGFSPLTLMEIYSKALSIDYDLGLPIRSVYPSTVPHVKYWSQRHRLFSLFDHGIFIDQESWYSVTPERIAYHQASRCFHRLSSAIEQPWSRLIKATRITCHEQYFTVWDMFCGAGGNAIAFSRNSGFCVTGFDTNNVRLESALRNSRVYGVAHDIELICTDSVSILASFPAVRQRFGSQGTYSPDMIFLSPPWGGPTYIDEDAFDLQSVFISECCILDIILGALRITPNVAAFLPKNTNLVPLLSAMVRYGQARKHFEVEKNYLNGKFKAVTIYFGDLAS